MNGKNIELTRRRVLGGLVTVGAASAAAGAGTFAVWNDSDQSTGNTIEAGSLSLGDTTQGAITAENVVPGEAITESDQTIETTFQSSSDVSSVAIDTAVSVSDISNPGDSQTATTFAESVLTDTVIQETPSESTDVSDQFDNLSQLAQSDSLETVTGVAQGESVGLTLGISFAEAAGNDLQNEGIEITVTFDAEQETN